MKRHQVTRKRKDGSTVTYWRGSGSGSSEKDAGKEMESLRSVGRRGATMGKRRSYNEDSESKRKSSEYARTKGIRGKRW